MVKKRDKCDLDKENAHMIMQKKNVLKSFWYDVPMQCDLVLDIEMESKTFDPLNLRACHLTLYIIFI